MSSGNALPVLVEETSDDFSKSISMSLKDGECQRPSANSGIASVPSGITTNSGSDRKRAPLDRGSSSQASFGSQSSGGFTDKRKHVSSGSIDGYYNSNNGRGYIQAGPQRAQSTSSGMSRMITSQSHSQTHLQLGTPAHASALPLTSASYHSGDTFRPGIPRQKLGQPLPSRRVQAITNSINSPANFSGGPSQGRSQAAPPSAVKKNLLSSFRRSSSATSSFPGSNSSSSGSRVFAGSFGSSVLKPFKSRSSITLDPSDSLSGNAPAHNSTGSGSKRTVIFRGYKLRDLVLIRNPNIEQVNMYGYPPGEGSNYAERHGPYEYAVAKVKQVHFEEISVYYTLTIEYSGLDIRGDAENMHPIRSKHAEETAIRVAKELRERDQREMMNQNSSHDDLDGNMQRSPCARALECLCYVLTWPFLLVYEVFVFVIGQPLYRVARSLYLWLQREARSLLNGMKPYQCAARITAVNLVVLCSSWYMFIDQARLAFFPVEFDDTLAHVNFVVWLILVCELLFEVFIRPDGYSQLIVSDKAFAPGTVRFISGLHLVCEIISLGFFVPEFLCIFPSANVTCDSKGQFSFFHAALIAIVGPTWQQVLAGRAFLACIRLRVFGLVRHWKNMWINTTFIQRSMELVLDGMKKQHLMISDTSHDASAEAAYQHVDEAMMKKRTESLAIVQQERDQALINASNIGTALMVTNSYRALMIVCAVIGFFPFLSVFFPEGAANCATSKMVMLLQEANKIVTADTEEGCKFLVESVESWVGSFAARDEASLSTSTDNFLLSLVIQPSRCVESISNATFLKDEYVVIPNKDCLSLSPSDRLDADSGSCIFISLPTSGSDLQQKANSLDLRFGAIQTERSAPHAGMLQSADGVSEEVVYAVLANFNQTYAVESSALLSFLLQLFLLVLVLGGLTVLRGDAEALVLNPLRSMLRIVARYAKNPLASNSTYERRGSSGAENSDSDNEDSLSLDGENSEGLQFSNYETEQLITAVSKITDLLRKCWGVAGADIISTNLASREGAFTEVFNPTVPGRSVYALFAFAAIEEFGHAQKCLGDHVMSLINDVAAVLHGEVFRWGFGDSGQCNKNLGGAFLMVFRIGLVKEVVQKLKEATNVVFATAGSKKIHRRGKSRASERGPHPSLSTSTTTNMRVSQTSISSSFSSSFQTSSFKQFASAKKAAGTIKAKVKNDSITEAMQLSLQSLPGISTFTDRAVIGMLKSFAGIHRDKKLRQWSQDFRLSAGVGAYAVNMVFGMDAGWAVEGAVGSEYKIDATYLSPHVNMASRMMSACKHYGVTILLSEAVQELMSDVAKSKLRNLDRVTVKGSSRVQKIFTYDARHKGANFFLLSRQDEQADLEAERYVPGMWHTDQDLTAMRYHLSDDFENEYASGLKAYYDGDWPLAIRKLKFANDIMVEDCMEGVDLDDANEEDIRAEISDGPSLYLINFMKSKGGKAPDGWAGWHPLLSK